MMRLRELVKRWGISARVPDIMIEDLLLDSRQVCHGRLFIAVSGAVTDGRRYIQNAIAQGAAAVMQEGETLDVSFQHETPVITLPDLAARLSELAAVFYATQARQLMLVGITGTNGKTSISHYVAELNRALGKPAGVIGTLGHGCGEKLTPLLNTTPDPLSVHRYIARMAEQGASHIAMEVSSHGLDQGRVAAVPYKIAVFSNLTRDHLDYHGNMQAYGEAKAKLFDWPSLQGAVINADDSFGMALLASQAKSQQAVIGYSLEPHSQLPEGCRLLSMQDIQATANGFKATICFAGEQQAAEIPLLGAFNLSNVLAAIGVLLLDGVPLQAICPLLASLKPVAGRMECFSQPAMPTAVVDYAHTPDALKQVLSAARRHCTGRLVCVFGCGGDRDRGKRPLMAQIAEQLADEVIVTADNPRHEALESINQEIMQGFSQPQAVTQVSDRHLAIQQALAQHGATDLVLIAGKGHEDYQLIGEQKLHFSDREVVAELMEAMA